MFQRDYILRMIEMMGDLMRRVKELMDELAQMRLLDGASRKRCGLPLSALETLSAESLTELLSPAPRLFASELIYFAPRPRRPSGKRAACSGSRACACCLRWRRKGRFASCAQRACRCSSWS